MELTLAIVLGLAALAVGILIWGQTQGYLTIFGDALAPAETTPLTIINHDRVVITTVAQESFASLDRFDTAASTALWNHESGEATLPAGVSEGIVQSLTVSSVTGSTVNVNLETTQDEPIGSAIYYAVSSDGGLNWTPLITGRVANFADLNQADWRWRVLMQRGTASRNPSVQNLTLKFTAEEP